ncbi:hypothetical protein M407DRAFT_198154 [Tulasnella calospora MUT 4182]|uniref:Uncharacterized protein n=1 Tax=Tulasnella calospora MUT 4182 TaxID=1051891 RepID=A0A0C3PNH2_9AGAM|nr:hypothetical protein M407DRAFT_198154 [Tulasnella calospora MUT 4182]
MENVNTLGYPIPAAEQIPATNLGYQFSLGFFDTFNTCRAKLNPHLKYVERLVTENEWVPVAYIERFMRIRASYNATRKYPTSRTKEMIIRRGHRWMRLIWKDLLKLREDVEDMAMRRMVTRRVGEAARMEAGETAIQRQTQSPGSAALGHPSEGGNVPAAESPPAIEAAEKAGNPSNSERPVTITDV